MTQLGGPAAINGFLYQLLQHIDLIMTAQLTMGDQSNCQLVFEPEDGGDAFIEEATKFRVEEYKTKSNGTWSVLEIFGVLNNLRHSVQSKYDDSAQYRFITNGRRGRLDPFDEFLDRVRSSKTLDDLDNVTVRKFTSRILKTDRGFFEHLESETRTSNSQATLQDYTEMLHLLSNFEMTFSISDEYVTRRIDTALKRYVPNLGTESDFRDRLVGVLMRRLKDGSLRLDKKKLIELLENAGLSPQRMLKLSKLHRRMGRLTSDRLRGLGYSSILDVRSAPIWPLNQPVLLINGESGDGKTWQLGGLLHSLQEQGRVTTLVPSSGTGDELLTHAARIVWQECLGETTDTTIIALSNWLRELNFSARELVLAFDDIRDFSVARHLMIQNWSTLGMRLVLTVPKRVAESLIKELGVKPHTVAKFSIEQLRDYLALASHNLDEFPQDLRRILQKPIFAGIFLRLEYTSFPDSPQSEYEIFEKFWDRIAAKGHPYDSDIVADLGEYMFRKDTYQIPRRSWTDLQLTTESVENLETSGWLQKEEGFVRFAHERLLNWAFAKWLVNAYLAKDIKLSDLEDTLVETVEGNLERGPSRFAYVPMDVLWLLGNDDRGRQDVPKLVEHLEKSNEFGNCGELLYAELLPTLGKCAVPVFHDRILDITRHDEHDHRLKLIGKGMTTLTTQGSVALRKILVMLLESPSVGCQNVALATVKNVPMSCTIDRLWSLHSQRMARLETRSDKWSLEDYKASYDALRATIATDPNWLRHKIECKDVSHKNLTALVYQLYDLDELNAYPLWTDTKNYLIDYTPRATPRSVLKCIERFADRECLDFVLEHLATREDWGSGTALNALAMIDPILALERLGDIDFEQLVGFRKRWLPTLMHEQPALTSQTIIELAQVNSWNIMKFRSLFNDIPNLIDKSILSCLLRTIERELQNSAEGTSIRVSVDWLSVRLKFLCRITDPDLLDIFALEKDGNLERLITKTVIKQSDNFSTSQSSFLFDSAYRFLLNIGGNGFLTVLRHQLASSDIRLRLCALRWTLVCSDPSIVPDVITLISHATESTEPAVRNSDDSMALNLAITTLAQLGEDEALVQIIEKIGWIEMTPQLMYLRRHSDPMPKQFTANARNVLKKFSTNKDSILSALLIAGLSGDRDLIPTVRSILSVVDPSTQIARFACVVLTELGDTSEKFAKLALRLFESSENIPIALKALSNVEETTLDYVAKWLKSQRETSTVSPDLEVALIRLLHKGDQTKASAIKAAVAVCRNSDQLLDPPFEIAGESMDTPTRNLIFDNAFNLDPMSNRHMIRAIEGLAKFDQRSAVQAAVIAIKSGSTDRRLLYVLTSIAPDDAARILIDIAISTQRRGLRLWIGRILRRLDTTEMTELVIYFLKHGNTILRTATVELACWLPNSRITDVLRDCAANDKNVELRLAALAAIDAHNDQLTVFRLLTALEHSDEQQSWRLLTALLNTGDPYLLRDANDGLTLDRILSRLPPAFTLHANDVLNSRRQTEVPIEQTEYQGDSTAANHSTVCLIFNEQYGQSIAQNE